MTEVQITEVYDPNNKMVRSHRTDPDEGHALWIEGVFLIRTLDDEIYSYPAHAVGYTFGFIVEEEEEG